MLTARMTAVLALLLAVTAAQVPTVATRGHAVARSGHAEASVFSVPVLAQTPLNWGQAPVGVSLEAPSLRIGSTAPGVAMTQVATPRAAFIVPGRILEQSRVPAPSPAGEAADHVADLRDALVQLALSLRDIPYVRGGHTPSMGFDCSGFVRYVFAHAIGMQMPTNAAAQFLAGLKVSRSRLKGGDLVFFHTEGRRHISHVGIYLSRGRFIHAPTTGKSVEVSSLHNAYWSRHFAGARRPAAIVAAASNG